MSYTIIDYTHQKIHEGVFRTVNYTELAVANNIFMRLYIKAPPNESIHFQVGYILAGKTYFKSISDFTLVSEGTAPDNVKLTHFNRVNGRPVGDMIVKYGATYTGGTIRGNQSLPGGQGGSANGIVSGDRIESVLLPNGEIILEFQNVSGQARDMTVLLDYYAERR